MAPTTKRTQTPSSTNQTSTTTERMSDGYGFHRRKTKSRGPTIVSYSYLKYVPKKLKAEYEALGWTVTDDLKGTHHGDYSYIGKYVTDRDRPPPMPEGRD